MNKPSAEVYDLNTFREVRANQKANENKSVWQCGRCKCKTWYLQCDQTFAGSDWDLTLQWGDVYP